MELAIDEIQRRHPNLDRMMCETLFKLHEQGKLDAFLPKLDTAPAHTDQCILQGAITVEEPVPENNLSNKVKGKPWCEGLLHE